MAEPTKPPAAQHRLPALAHLSPAPSEQMSRRQGNPLLPPSPDMWLAVWKAGPLSSQLHTQGNPLPPPFVWAKENDKLSVLCILSFWSGCRQSSSLLVEGDAGFASRWVQDLVVRARPWPQPGLMAVSRGCGFRRLGVVCSS